MLYTGIGSRSTPKDVCEKMIRIAQILAVRGHVLRSGGALGADKAFETGHLLINENLEIFIPWKNFVTEIKSYHRLIIDKSIEKQANEIVSKIHPAWNACSSGARKLHARNVNQILGEDLKTPSQFLICWTSSGKPEGGSATAINLALQNNIPVFNLQSLELLELSSMDIVKHIAKNISDNL